MTTDNPGPRHGKTICGGTKRDRKRGGTGEPCRRPAGWGTSHAGIGRCKLHGGSTPDHVKHAAVERAKQAVAKLNLRREVDPHIALLDEVYRAAGVVAWLDEKVRSLQETEMVWGVTEQVEKTAGEFPGIDTTSAADLNVWIKWWQQERAQLARVAKMALDAGVEERRVKLAEQQGALLADVIRRILGDLDLTPEQQKKVPTVVPRHLRLVAS